MKRLHLSKYVLLALVAALLLTGGAVAQTQCDAANALFKAQLYDAAQTNYTALLQQYPTLPCALNGINESQRALAINFYELGRDYENAGQVDLARSAYIEALKKNQTFTEAQKALEYLPGGNIPYWRDVRSWIGRWGLPVGEIVIFLLGLYILRYRIWPWLWSFCKRPLDIQEFDNKATGLEIGKVMMAMVEESLMRLGQEERFRVNLSAGSTEKFNIPADIKGVSPQIMIISNLIEWILPSNVITVSGYLEKPGNRGAGLTLSMVKSQTGDILGNITIWQKDYDPKVTQSSVKDNDPVPYYSLVEPAAIWALFQLNAPSKIIRGIFCRIYYGIKKLFRKVEDPDKFTPLGTDDWQSYAYLRAGARWRLESQDDKARLMFLNVRNRYENAALFNLGVLYTEAGEYERALEQLERVKKDTNPNTILWYNAEYYLALTYRYKGDLLQAKEEAKLLVNTISKTISGLDKKKKELRKSLEELRPMACIMYANTLVYVGEIKEAESMIKPLDPSRLTYRARYNLACHYSIYGEKAPVNVEKRNAAYKMALQHLEYALERGGGIVEWANKDPALNGVRQDKETQNKFAKLIQKYGDQAAQDSADMPLAGIAIIKEAYAKQLKEQGIVSHCDLILKADTHQAQEALAKKLGISTKLLHRWALLADLMRIEGITPQYVNLLEAADVGSLDALTKESDTCELTNLLNQINNAQSLVKTPPPIETVTVQQWVQDAKKKTKPKVL
jgi:tetratricopeptide (TPR) repeat protein